MFARTVVRTFKQIGVIAPIAAHYLKNKVIAKRILVIEDEANIVRTVRLYLEKAGFKVDWVTDGTQGLAAFRRSHLALVLLDLNLPGELDGLDVCRTLRRESNVPIIMLTARSEETDKLIGLELGADDYITKPFNPREVVARVKAQLRRSQLQKGVQSPLRLKAGELTLDIGTRELIRRGDEIDLTPSEFEIMKVLMSNPGFVITRSELAEKALGYGSEGVGRTLDSHIKNIRKKIDIPQEGESFIQTVHGVGYRLRDRA
jgi:two-component system alkaline phosphatase synthesis response regulator PhoP